MLDSGLHHEHVPREGLGGVNFETSQADQYIIYADSFGPLMQDGWKIAPPPRKRMRRRKLSLVAKDLPRRSRRRAHQRLEPIDRSANTEKGGQTERGGETGHTQKYFIH